MLDEAIDVIHPVADGNVDLGNSDQDGNVNNDVWQRIRSQLKFSIPENPRLVSQRNWFVKHPNYLNRVAKRDGLAEFTVDNIDFNWFEGRAPKGRRL